MNETAKKNIFMTLLILVLALFALFYKLYHDQRMDNLALTLKMRLLSTDKKEAKRFKTAATATGSGTPSLQSTRLAQKQEATSTDSDILNQLKQQKEEGKVSDLRERSLDELASQLLQMMESYQTLDLDGINNAIDIAEEILVREPDSYDAYKAKLILLLTKEGKFSEEISDYEVYRLLSSMASFEIASDESLISEAFAISQTNKELDAVNTQIADLENEIALVNQNIESRPEGSDEIKRLQIQRSVLEDQLAGQLMESDRLENELEGQLLRGGNALQEDIVEIPFKRALAKEQYEQVISDAKDLLAAFPNSALGYYYWIRGLELNGQMNEALRVIQNSRLTDEKAKELRARLQQASDPKTYWQSLSF